MHGKHLVSFKEELFQKVLGDFQGSALYVELQKLKGPPNIEAIFEEIHQKHPEFQFKTVIIK